MRCTRSLIITLAAGLFAASLLGGCDKDKGLKITSIEPKIVPVEGGEVVIHGNGFQTEGSAGDVTVYFGDKRGKVVNIDGDDKIVVRAPSGSPNEKVNVKLIFADSREFVYKDACSYANINEGYSVDSLTKDKDKKATPPAPDTKPEEKKPE